MATKDYRNICKFVPYSVPVSLTTSTFIYENNAPERGLTRVHPRNTMFLVISGDGLFSSALGDYPLSAGTVFFSFDSMPYRIDNTDALRYMYIDFSGPRAQALFERFSISPAHCIFRGYEGLIPFWQDSLSIANDQNLDLVCESVLLYSFSRLSNTFERSEDHLIGHAMGQITIVAQCTYGKGGTWDGTTKNLRFGWSPVFCYSDGSDAAEHLIQMGAQPVATSGLQMLEKLQATRICFFDQ